MERGNTKMAEEPEGCGTQQAGVTDKISSARSKQWKANEMARANRWSAAAIAAPAIAKTCSGAEWKSASRELGPLPRTQELPGARQGKPNGGDEKCYARNGIDGVRLGEALLPKRLDENAKAEIQLRRLTGQSVPSGTGKGGKRKKSFAIPLENGRRHEARGKRAERLAECTAGSA